MGRNATQLPANLRSWRLRRGLSVSALARAAGISKSTVSELERGNGNPSLDTLWALVESLNIPLGALFARSQSASELEVLRLDQAPMLGAAIEGHRARLLAGWPGRGEIEVAFVELAEDARRNSTGNAPGVIERAVCAYGVVEVGTDERSVVLRVGDLVSFRADQPHYYHAVGGSGKLLVVQHYSATE